MTRLRLLATAVLPSMLVGGLLFSTASGQPAPPSAPAAPPAPAAPMPPAPPEPPAPPTPDSTNITVSINGHQVTLPVELGDVRKIVLAQLAQARRQLQDPNLPPAVRKRLAKRLDKLSAKLDGRLRKIDAHDLSHLDEQMEQIGADVATAMNGFGQDMGSWGEQLGQQLQQQIQQQVEQQIRVHVRGGSNQFHWDSRDDHDSNDNDGDHDDDDDDDRAPAPAPAPTPGPGMTPVDPYSSSMQTANPAIEQLGDLGLQPAQREELVRIRTESKQHVAAARAEVAKRSDELRAQLRDLNVDRDQISHAIDAVSEAEAELRKAKILAWVDARRVLDDGQRKRVEDAAKHPPR